MLRFISPTEEAGNEIEHIKIILYVVETHAMIETSTCIAILYGFHC